MPVLEQSYSYIFISIVAPSAAADSSAPSPFNRDGSKQGALALQFTRHGHACRAEHTQAAGMGGGQVHRARINKDVISENKVDVSFHKSFWE